MFVSRECWISSWGVLAIVPLLGCAPKVDIARLPDQTPTFRAANSFIHCVEGANSLCVKSGRALVGWDALFLLVWLSDGSPVSIVGALQPQLNAHSNPRVVERRFVEEIERYAAVLRGAECDAVAERPLGGLIDEVSRDAVARLQRLGLWQRGMVEAVTLLTAEAHRDLEDGALVRLDCKSDPYRVHVAAIESDGFYEIIGMTTLLPEKLGDLRPSSEVVQDRLQSRSLGLAGAAGMIAENTIDPWLTFPVEEL